MPAVLQTHEARIGEIARLSTAARERLATGDDQVSSPFAAQPRLLAESRAREACAGSLICLRSALRRMSQIEQAALAHRSDRSGARGVGVSALIF